MHLYAQCWNDARMLPFFFRHYDAIVDRYFIYDDGSTDGSLEMLDAHARVEVRRFRRAVPASFVLSEKALSDSCWKSSRGDADWVIVTDIDEHLTHRDMADYLHRCADAGVTIVPALGFNMISDDPPPHDADLPEDFPVGAPEATMMKTSIFSPNAIAEIDFAPGRHTATPTGRVVAPTAAEVVLLHYKYLGFQQTYARHQEESTGLGTVDLQRDFGSQYTWSEEQLRGEWERVRSGAIDTRGVRDDPAPTYPYLPWWADFPRVDVGAPRSGGSPSQEPRRSQGSSRRVKLFVCIYDDARMLPAFLDHYAGFGVDEFHIAVPDDLAPLVESLSTGHDVRLHRGLDVADSFLGGVEAVTQMRQLHQGVDESVVIVDLDEFVEFEGPIDDVMTEMETEGANVMRGIMFDRFALDGQPKRITETSDLPMLFPVRARFTQVILGGTDFKGVVVRGRLASRGAHHLFRDEHLATRVLDISHYKWNDRALERVRKAYAMLAAEDKHWAWESRNVLDHYEAHGRFAWETFGGEIIGHEPRAWSGPDEADAPHAYSIRSLDAGAAPVILREAEQAAMKRVLESDTWVEGVEVDAFEKEWAVSCGTDGAVAVGSGHDAIEIGLRALGLGQGDEIIIPAVAPFATMLAVMRAGCTPVLADIDPATALLDLRSAERCLTPGTRGVMLVHQYGQVADLPKWQAWTSSHGLFLIEDCASAHLGVWAGLGAGSVGAFGAYGFDPTTNLAATGDAGAIVTSDERLLGKARRLRDLGRDDDGRHVDIGTSSRLGELQAALLRARLRWLRERTPKRHRIAMMFQAEISNPAIELMVAPAVPERHVYHRFVVRAQRRPDFIDHLTQRGIETQVHPPRAIHEDPLTRGARRDEAGLPNATRHARECVSLPLHPALTDGDVDAIIRAVNAFG